MTVLVALALTGCAPEPNECAGCDPARQYCETLGNDVPPPREYRSCEQLPTACLEAPSCDCLQREPDTANGGGEDRIDGDCSQSIGGLIHVFVPGG